MTEQLTMDTNATEAETSSPEVQTEPAAATEVSLSPVRDAESPPVQPPAMPEEASVEPKKAPPKRKPATEKKSAAMADLEQKIADLEGLADKFRQYAPKVDPFSDKGRADLEQWAADNPELRDARPVPTPEFDVSAQVKSFASPHLISTESWKDSRKAARKSGGDR